MQRWQSPIYKLFYKLSQIKYEQVVHDFVSLNCIFFMVSRERDRKPTLSSKFLIRVRFKWLRFYKKCKFKNYNSQEFMKLSELKKLSFFRGKTILIFSFLVIYMSYSQRYPLLIGLSKNDWEIHVFLSWNLWYLIFQIIKIDI